MKRPKRDSTRCYLGNAQEEADEEDDWRDEEMAAAKDEVSWKRLELRCQLK